MNGNSTDIEKHNALTASLMGYLKDEQAVDFCMSVVYVAHVWDDLVDGGQRTAKEINDAFWACLFSIPYNPFYQKHSSVLRPVMMNAVLQWEDANTLEHGSAHDKHMAFMLRASICQLFNVCAMLLHGLDYARSVGPDLRRLYEESLESFMEEKNA
jgi:hypothetical protein